MSRYSPERKEAVLSKLLPPHNLSLEEVSAQEGISVSCLYNWRNQAKRGGKAVPGARKPNSDEWSNEDKLAVIIETASMTAQELSEYCRSKGLYPDQIDQWKQGFIQSPKKELEPLVGARKRIKQLEKELQRKDKALAEAAALLVLQKKFQAMFGEEES